MTNNQRDLTFKAWAPTASPWSPWAKPVLFANLPIDADAAATPAIDPIRLPRLDGPIAFVVDLPAEQSIAVGMALAANGYRPVPLFNALPGPTPSPSVKTPQVAVDLWPAARALTSAAPELLRLNLPRHAPPAFLLDANRRGAHVVTAGDFDNRSVSLTTDFPSAATLGGAGISQVTLISTKGDVAIDLAHTLLRWQNAGLAIQAWDLESDQTSATLLRVTRPSAFGLMFQRLLAVIGLRSSPFGGFGALLPIPSSG